MDPGPLIRETCRIEGGGGAECRSILMDWALSVGPEQQQRAALERLMARHGAAAPDHPMTALMSEGLSDVARGGRLARAAGQPKPGRPPGGGQRGGGSAPVSVPETPPEYFQPGDACGAGPVWRPPSE